MRQRLIQLRLADDQAFTGRFYSLLAYSCQVIDLGYALDLSQQSLKQPKVASGDANHTRDCLGIQWWKAHP